MRLITGVLLDRLLGDPHGWYHPIRTIGSFISGCEKVLRRCLPKTKGGEFSGGVLLCGAVLAFSGGVPFLLLRLAGAVHPALEWALGSVMCYQLLAARSLRDESMKVHDALERGDVEGARYAVSMIVGRDTKPLTKEGIIKAAVETVAENASDGVIAPLLYMAIGGPVAGFLYKGINTMDSMVGYRNEKYLYFGRCAARLDDLLNFLPARIAGVLMCLAARPAGFDGKNAWRIFLRDRRKHKSPNSAHTEAAAAGALDVELAGSSWYFGELVEKPAIGDPLRPVEAADILRCDRLMYAAAFLAMVLFCGLPLLLHLAWT